ncbi:XRE family transcriptional regulator [Rosenbergiella epipactidis]|uniref:XRE family transcriptional regulator n=1 Tax=Rosenbergiella epipactidis TaxID=1544694 RepID=UPI001F4E0F1B|nr:S24 family peptidase [Rosenbergiella epipactidis]
MKIGEKIRALRKSKGMTISELALLSDSDVGNISRLERGKQSYTEKSLTNIAAALGVKISDLFTSETITDTVNKNSDSGGGDVYRVEVLNVSASAGHGVQHSEFLNVIRAIDYDPEQAYSMFGRIPPNMVKLITVRGDSMQGTIDPGDLIFVDQRIQFFDGDGIYVFSFAGDIYVKRLQKVKKEILVISDNTKYKDWSIDESEGSQLLIAGKVMLSQSQQLKRHA